MADLRGERLGRGPIGVQILLFSCSFPQTNYKTRLHSSRMRVPGPGGVPGPGVYLVPGGCTWSGTPPVNRITHTCKNITLPQLRCGR